MCIDVFLLAYLAASCVISNAYKRSLVVRLAFYVKVRFKRNKK